MNTNAFRGWGWFVLAVGLSLFSIPAQAQVTWNNAGAGNWFTSTNWTPGVVPTSVISASINNGGTAQVQIAGGQVNVLTLGAALGQSGTLEINAGTLTTTSFLLVGDFGTGTVTVSNGGILGSGIAGIGNNAGAVGTINVIGANSRWNVNGSVFDVGSSGNGTLNVTEGGTVAAAGRIMNLGNDTTAPVGLVVITGNTLATSLTVALSNIGNSLTSSGQVQVHGALATYAGGSINVGMNGPGTLAMDTGANGTASGISLGTTAVLGATGTMTLDNATMAATGTVSVGISNTAAMTLSNGAVLTSSAGRMGNNTGAIGQLTVTGANSRWTMTGDLTTGSIASPGTGGSATISVLDGGLIRSNRLFANSAVNINVSGAGSRFEVLDSTSIGSPNLAVAHAHSLTVQNGGAMTVGDPVGLTDSFGVFAGAGDTTTLLFTGTGTMVTANGGLDFSGAGIVNGTISAQAQVSVLSSAPNVSSFDIGLTAGGVHSMTVNGVGTLFNNTGWTLVGDNGGTATLTVENGAVMNATFASVARRMNSTGTVVVQGAGTLFDANANGGGHDTVIGDGGAGFLRVLDGGEFRARSIMMSNSFLGSTGTGDVLVSGANSTITLFGTFPSGGELRVGVFGTATARFENGGQLIANALSIAGNSTSTSSVTVTGVGTAITLTGDIGVGGNGNGTLTVDSGATIQSDEGFVGQLAGSVGTVTLSGNGTSWTMVQDLEIGFFGTGSMTVDTQALVSTTRVRLNIASSAALASVLNVNSGATIVTSQIAEGGGTGGSELNINGGILRATVNQADFLSAFEAGDVEFLVGGVTIDSNGFGIGIGVPLVGAGGMTKTGVGVLTISDVTSYLGPTQVAMGTLQVTGTMSNTAVTVSNGAILGGTGTISGAVTILDGGIIAPGASPGILTVGSLALNGLSRLDYELGPAQPPGIAGTDSDLIEITGALTLDGLLDITDVGSFGTGTYRLMNYGGVLLNNTLSFGNVPLGFNYAIDTNTATQVNLIVNAAGLEYWDGPNLVANGVADGGTGVWNNALTNWTGSTGAPNAAWAGTTAVFQGTAGTVTLGDNISYEGMQFLVDGYVVNPDGGNAFALLPDGAAAPIRTDTGVTATINARIGGAGGLLKTNAGDLVLTGANTYGGGTTIAGGTLFANNAAGSATGTGAVMVQSGGTLAGTGAVAGPVTVVDGGAIRPFDGLTGGVLDGGGSLTLNNASVLNYVLGAPGSVTNSRIDVAGNLRLDGLLNVTDGGGFTADTYLLMNYGGILTDANLTIQSLPAGFNPGNFFIDTSTAGQVHLAVVPAGPGPGSGAGVQYWDGSFPLANGQINGGSGVWNVTDTNWTNAQGNVNGPWAGETAIFTTTPGLVTLGSDVPFQHLIFQVSGYRIVSPAGQRLFSLGDAQVTVVGGGQATIAAPLAIPGLFTKSGTGNLILAGLQPSQVGGTVIQQGGLYVNTVLISPFVRVNHDGTLGGNGVIIGNVLNQGTVAPGNSVGTLTIRGNFRQTGSGTLQLEVASAHRFDQLVVSGTAHLGGTLQVRSLGANLEYGDQFPFLHAGRIKGRFARILVPHPSVNRGRFYTVGGTGILLIAPTSYTLVATTPNQTRLARALDQWIGIEDGDIGATTLALDLLREEQYPAAFEAILPGHYDATVQISTEMAHSQMQGLHQQFSSRRLTQRAMGAKAFRLSAPQAPSTKNPKSVKGLHDALSPLEENRWYGWTQATGLFSQTGWGLTPDRDFDSGIFLAGADYALSDQVSLGLFAGYQIGEGDYEGSNEADLEKVVFGAYALYDRGNFYAHASVEAGEVEYEVRRAIVLPTLDRTARSEPDGHEVSASFGTGYDFEAGNFTFGPSFTIQYTRQNVNQFTEHGAESLDLRLDDFSVDSLRTYLGLRAACTMKLPGELTLIPEVRAFWQHEFLQDGETLSSHLDGGAGPGFDYITEDPDRDSLYLGAGLNFQIGARCQGSLFYHAEFGRTDETNHTVSLTAGWRF